MEYHKVSRPAKIDKPAAVERNNPFVVDDDDEDEEVARLTSPIDLLAFLSSSPLPSSPLKKPVKSTRVLQEKKRQSREESPEIAFLPVQLRAASRTSNRSSASSLYVDYDPAAHLIIPTTTVQRASSRQSDRSTTDTGNILVFSIDHKFS